MTSLLIVESKAKCKKIEGILGKGYRCLASLGHLYELAPGLEAIDIGNNFKPSYQLIPGKSHVLRELRKVARQVDTIYLAADPDREGEMIAKHVQEALQLSPSKFRRITFNEITATAIRGALTRPREIDENLCKAQEARRVLDRLFGYEWSPLLWKYVASKLSAGRCQSPALGLMCDREADLRAFSAKQFYKIMGQLCLSQTKLTQSSKTGKKTEVPLLDVTHPTQIPDRERCLELLTRLLLATFSIQAIKKRNKESNPSPPFTTSTMQQEASGRLSMNPKRTMSTAQRLYERGHITYMRTDSTALSTQAKTEIGDYVTGRWGAEYHCAGGAGASGAERPGKKAKNSQEAHEAIRPVRVDHIPSDMKFDSADELRLYDLVWKRAVASQMAARRFTEQIATVVALQDGVRFLELLSHETETTFPGYEILYNKSEGSLTRLTQGMPLYLDKLEGDEQDTKPKPRYTEASLIKDLEKRGIGRPSTFSTIITTLLDRNYVEHCPTGTGYKDRHHMEITGGEQGQTRGVVAKTVKRRNTSMKGKLQATELGFRVRDFLREHYEAITTDRLTSQLEEQLDRVAAGELDGVSVVRAFYDDYHPKVEELRGSGGSGGSGGSRCVHELGISGKYKYVRLETRYGWAWARSNASAARGSQKYVSIASDLYGEGADLSLEQVKCLYKFPRKISYEDGTVVDFCYGKQGFYLKHDQSSRPLEGDFSGDTLPSSEDMACFQLQLQERAFRPQGSDPDSSGIPFKKGPLRKIGDYTVWNGKFGLFVSKEAEGKKRARGAKNATGSLPTDCEVELLTEEMCEAAIKKQQERKGTKWKKGK